MPLVTFDQSGDAYAVCTPTMSFINTYLTPHRALQRRVRWPNRHSAGYCVREIGSSVSGRVKQMTYEIDTCLFMTSHLVLIL